MQHKYKYEIKEGLSKKTPKGSEKRPCSICGGYEKNSATCRKTIPWQASCRRRVHIGHFVLTYGIDEKEHKVIFLNLSHHDEAYITKRC